jgi:CubicO group peptidase (beta-lactamase class C family)
MLAAAAIIFNLQLSRKAPQPEGRIAGGTFRTRRGVCRGRAMALITLPRRRFMQLIALAATAPPWLIPSSAAAQPRPPAGTAEPTQSERLAMSNLAGAFMQEYAIPGLSVAVGRAGAILYEDAFGWADRETREAVSPTHLFRIASVTKPITSVALFSLIEEGRIRLTDRIFGPGAIIGSDYGEPPYHPWVDQITVEHLLTHTSGGWGNGAADPIFANPGMNQAQLIESTLRNRPLDQPPGRHYAYSNFGYCVLGRVIEKITQQNYATYVRDAVLRRCGVTDMTIGGGTLAQRHQGEVKYYGEQEEREPYAVDVARIDSVGGWIGRPRDLVNFVMHVNGFSMPRNILEPQSIRTMTTASAANPGYAKGWAVNKFDNWWHVGSLPGTSTIAVRTHSGLCWAAFGNSRRSDSPLDRDLDNLIWDMVRQVKSWAA